MTGVARRGGGAGEGGPARGYSWPPFEQGNTVSTRHGAYGSIDGVPGGDALKHLASM